MPVFQINHQRCPIKPNTRIKKEIEIHDANGLPTTTDPISTSQERVNNQSPETPQGRIKKAIELQEPNLLRMDHPTPTSSNIPNNTNPFTPQRIRKLIHILGPPHKIQKDETQQRPTNQNNARSSLQNSATLRPPKSMAKPFVPHENKNPATRSNRESPPKESKIPKHVKKYPLVTT